MEDKEKWKIYRKKWRDKNQERIKAYNKEYNKTRDKEKIKAYQKEYNQKPKTEEQKERYRKYQNEYHKKYQKGRGREKYLLRSLAQRKFRKQIISKRKKCEECGSMENLELHHKNYEENIEENVILLCKVCHKRVHNNI